MRAIRTFLLAVAMMAAAVAVASDYSETIDLFKHAGQSAAFFDKSYGYAVFPTIGKGGLIVGAAHGNGHVYEHGKYIGNTSVTQVSVGFQAGGQAYSQIIFFEDKRALDEFTNGNFEFEAGVSAVAITAAAGGTAGTSGASAGASGGKKNATNVGSAYYKGMAAFTLAKGGAMVQATVAGEEIYFWGEGQSAAQ